ncbi:hypothetical protein AHF37_08738 [Paragonimus kellicotti]|nr:hypothetical protein AHF37_08738 [Paragonimus kellicotti]
MQRRAEMGYGTASRNVDYSSNVTDLRNTPTCIFTAQDWSFAGFRTIDEFTVPHMLQDSTAFHSSHTSQLSKLSLIERSRRTWNAYFIQQVSVRDLVLPIDAYGSSEAAQIEYFQVEVFSHVP